MAKGYKNVYALKGGWDAWEKAGFPVEPKVNG
jgi:rhodanese-related sulfurtransferase